MNRLTDDELLDELSKRIHQQQESLEELKRMTAQLKELNIKLEESEKLKTHFLSNIRNEIINPFASIIGLSRNITTLDVSKIDKIHSFSSMIHSEAFTLDFQLQNIFAAAEIEAGEIHPDYMQIDMNGLFNSVIESFKHEVLKKKLQVNYSTCCDQLHFKSDPEKIKLIFSNLFCNAVKYSHTGGSIAVEVDYDKKELVLKVKDDGIGINAEDLQIIFDRFRRVDPAINTLNSGHGLGLSIVRSLVDILGGHVEVKSEKEKGSMFIATIPEALSLESMQGLAMDGNEFLFESEGEVF